MDVCVCVFVRVCLYACLCVWVCVLLVCVCQQPPARAVQISTTGSATTPVASVSTPPRRLSSFPLRFLFSFFLQDENWNLSDLKNIISYRLLLWYCFSYQRFWSNQRCVHICNLVFFYRKCTFPFKEDLKERACQIRPPNHVLNQLTIPNHVLNQLAIPNHVRNQFGIPNHVLNQLAIPNYFQINDTKQLSTCVQFNCNHKDIVQRNQFTITFHQKAPS